MSHHGSDSFALRRPHATNLPNFELPPPPMNPQKFGYPGQSAPHQGHSLPTPPVTGVSAPAANSSQAGGQYTPQSYVWSPHHQNQSYGFQSAGATQSSFSQSRSSASALPPPPYEVHLPPFPSSGPMSAPATVPTMPTHHQQNAPMPSSTPVSSAPHHPSPAHAQEPFRPPPTPGYYSNQGSTPQQQQFPFSSGPSPTQASPMTAGGSMSRMSPSTAGPMPPMSAATQQSPHTYQRPFPQYPLPGPVLSNVQNPNGQIQLVNGPPLHGMPLPFNSGHAAGMHHHMYQNQQHTPQPPAPPSTNDRPFKCDQCPQSFNRNHDLKRHKRIHLAVKPFPCGHCDKSFSRKDALKRHILVKGCGKAAAAAEAAAAAAAAEKGDGSASPDQQLDGQSGGMDVKPPTSLH